MFWRDKYGSIIKEKAQGPLRQERKGREVKIHHCFSSSFDVAFCFFLNYPSASLLFHPRKSQVINWLNFDIVVSQRKGRPKEREEDRRIFPIWPVTGAVRTNSYMDMGCAALNNYNSDIRDHHNTQNNNENVWSFARIIKMWQKWVKKCFWKNGSNRLAWQGCHEHSFCKKCNICKAQ